MMTAHDNESQSLEAQLLSAQYRVSPEAFWDAARLRGDCGYDLMEPARTRGWDAIPGWGRNGWDLGSWPYVVIYHRAIKDSWQLAYYVEGDLTVYGYPTRELRDAATDCLAFWHWKHNEEDWVASIDSADVAPDHLRGAFSWRRPDAEQIP
jgi:hypothetical protein